MTQEQRNKKAGQLRLAAQIIETGCEWEVKLCSGWFPNGHIQTAQWGCPLDAINSGLEIRIKQPVIPVPEGWRELRDDEKDYKWVVGAKYLADNGEWMHPKHRDGGAFAAKTHRIIVPVAKPRVPLGPEDVAPGSVIRPVKRPDSVSDCWAAVISTGEVGVQAVRRGDIEGYSYSDLMAEFEIKRPADTKFQPCSKEAES